MKALFCYNENKFRLEEMARPSIREEEMLMEMLYTGLCGSDIVKIFDPEVKKPAVFGHEVVGRVIEAGKKVTGFDVGDIVVAAHHIPCYHCHYCLHGNHSMCRHFKETNIFPGSFCQYIRLSKEHVKYTTFKIPSDFNLVESLFIEPLACCIRALERLSFLKNDIFSVVGAGVIGMLFIQLIRLSGGRVISVDLDSRRLSQAKNIGADYVIDPSCQNIKEEVQKITSIGADIVILTVTDKNTMADSLSYIRDGGTINIFGASGRGSRFEIDFEKVYKRELTIKSSYSATPKNLKQAYDMVLGKKVDLSPLISKTMPIADFKKGMDLMLKRKIYKAIFRL
jgi:L-iditol 2-dehydrogenase